MGRGRGRRGRIFFSLVLAAVLVLALVAMGTAGSGPETEEDLVAFENPCVSVMDARGGQGDPLASAGLQGLSVPRSLFQQFPPLNVTCTSSTTASGGHVRGVFVELADEGGTVAVYAALHPSEENSAWRIYLSETFAQSKFDFYGDGPAIFALRAGHPKAAAARAFTDGFTGDGFRNVGDATSLWSSVAHLVNEDGGTG